MKSQNTNVAQPGDNHTGIALHPEHVQLVQSLIVQIGGDPTVVTPCANLQAVASRGIGDVLLDPRTTLLECLDAILVAELADHEAAAHPAQLARSHTGPWALRVVRSAPFPDAGIPTTPRPLRGPPPRAAPVSALQSPSGGCETRSFTPS